MEATSVTLYVDPVCPFAWITSRWLVEVEAQRPLEVEFKIMSLSVLNENRELDDWYREFNDLAWGSARVGAVVQRDHGAAAYRAYYEAFGRRRHEGGDRDHAKVVAEAPAETGLPAGLLRFTTAGPDGVATDAAVTQEIAEADALLHATQAEVQALVGEESGTPVVVVEGAAFFGPVSTRIARGEEAVRQFEAVRLLATCPAFAELKRARRGDLSFA